MQSSNESLIVYLVLVVLLMVVLISFRAAPMFVYGGKEFRRGGMQQSYTCFGNQVPFLNLDKLH